MNNKSYLFRGWYYRKHSIKLSLKIIWQCLLVQIWRLLRLSILEWSTTDLIIVIGNMIKSIISLLPAAFFLFVFITSYTPYSIYNPKELITTDLLVRPISILSPYYIVDEWVIMVAALVLSYGLLTILS